MHTPSSRPTRHALFLLLAFVVCCSAPSSPGLGPPGGVGGHPPPIPGDVTCPAYDASTLPPALSVVDPPPIAGTMAGAFSVSPQGQATYTLPLVPLPGRLGMEPKLSISYDSSSGDGPLGMGFSLQGLSAITRCPKTIARDGVVEAVRLDGTDPLCLDGLRLVEVAPVTPNGPNTHEFRTFPDTFAKVVGTANRELGWVSFEVRTKAGRILEYGQTTNSRVRTAGPAVASWWLSRESDRRGNAMSYAYLNDTDADGHTLEMLPQRIDYTQHGSTPGTRAVVFEYFERNIPHDSWSLGMKQRRTRLLGTVRMVRVEAGPDPDVDYRAYQLGYVDSAGTLRQLLGSISECTAEGGWCKPPTRFQWTGETAHFTAQTTPHIRSNPGNAYPWVLADVNGDGLADIVFVEPSRSASADEVLVALNTGKGGFAEPEVWLPELTIPESYGDPSREKWLLTPLDIDQDGRTDIFLDRPTPKQSAWPRYLWLRSTGTNFQIVTSSVPRPPDDASPPQGDTPRQAFLGDLNGDGVADLIQCSHPSASALPRWTVNLWSPTLHDFDAALPTTPFGDANLPCSTQPYVLDAVGSGASQILAPGSGSGGVFGFGQYLAARFRTSTQTWDDPPTGFPVAAPASALAPNASADVQWLDVNGDGLPDALYSGVNYCQAVYGYDDSNHCQSVVFLNKGLGLAEPVPLLNQADPTAWVFTDPSVRLDFNGDGQTDLLVPPYAIQGVYVDGGHWSVLQVEGTGNGSVSKVVTSIPFKPAPTDPTVPSQTWFTPQVTDVNGDGRHDVIAPDVSDDGRFVVYTNTGPQDLLAAVTDGMSPLDPGDPGFVPTVAIHYGNLVDASITENVGAGSAAAEAMLYLSRSDPNDDCPFPRTCVKGSERVVSGYVLNNGENGTRSFEVKYRNGRYDRLGNGDLGFGERLVLDVEAGSGSAERYDTLTYDGQYRTYPLAGHVVESWTWSPAGATQPQATQVELGHRLESAVVVPTSPAPLGSFAPGTYFMLRWKTETTRGEGDFTASPGETLLDYALTTAPAPPVLLGDAFALSLSADGFGNVLTLQTFADGVDETTTVTRTVENDQAAWLIGLVKSEEACSTAAGETQCRTKQLTYDGFGQVTSASVGDPGDAHTQLTLGYTYDQFGNVVRATADDKDGDHRASCVSYEPEGIFPYAARNTLGHTVLTGYDPALGVLSAAVDANRHATRYQHDAFGRITERIRPDGTYTTSTLTRTKNGGPQQRWWNVEVVTHEDEGPETATELDGAGRPVRTVRRTAGIYSCGASACDKTLSLEQETAYDLFGRVSRATLPWMAGDSLQGQLAHTYQYDAIGRVTRHMEPWGRITTFSYGDNTTTATDWLGSSSGTVDALGRTIRTQDKMGGAVETAYGPFSLPSTVTRFGNEVTTTKRDAYGRVIYESDPDRGDTHLTYDGFGETRVIDDDAGREVTFTYDGLGRRVQRDDGGTQPAATTIWTYDTAPNGVGLLAGVTSPTENVDTYAYDGLSRPSGHALKVKDTGEILSWRLTYDSVGRPSTLLYPQVAGVAAPAVRRAYDAYGNLASLHDDSTGTTLWQLEQLDGAGRATLEVLGSATQVRRAYQPSTGLVEHVGSAWFKTKVLSTTLQDLSYTYDPGLRMTSRTDGLQQGPLGLAAEEVFHHDARDRLTCASLNVLALECDNPIAYEDNGNIHTKDGLTYAYHADHPHAVKTVEGGGAASSSAFAYDAVGNQTHRATAASGHVVVHYTPFDLPARYDLAGDAGTVTFDYDGNQRRILKRSALAETTYFDDLYEHARSAGGDVHKFYVAAGSSTVVLTRAPGAADQTQYLLGEALGSTDVVSDDGGTVVERRSYDAFGARRNPVWSGPIQTSFTSQVSTVGFTGQEADDDHGLGLVNMRGRIYDPKIGRFTTVDPLVPRPSFSQSWNPYSYVHNSPLNFTDPSGFDESGGASDGSWSPGPDGPTTYTFADDPLHALPPGPIAPAPLASGAADANSKADGVQSDTVAGVVPSNGGSDGTGGAPTTANSGANGAPTTTNSNVPAEPAWPFNFNERARGWIAEDDLTQRRWATGAGGAPPALAGGSHPIAGAIPIIGLAVSVGSDTSAVPADIGAAVGSISGLKLLPSTNTLGTLLADTRGGVRLPIGEIRPVTPADIGLRANTPLAALQGTVTTAGTTRVISVGYIQAATPGALLGQIRSVVPNLLITARAEGISTLQIEATFANERLQAFVIGEAQRAGGIFSTYGGRDTLTFLLGGR